MALPATIAVAPPVAPQPAGAVMRRNPFKIGPWDSESAWTFMSSLDGTAKSLMARLIVVKSTTSGEIADYIKVQATTLGPAIRSIKSKAQALGKRVPFEIKTQSGGAGKIYVLTSDFSQAASSPRLSISAA
jgi:hypothetical protein